MVRDREISGDGIPSLNEDRETRRASLAKKRVSFASLAAMFAAMAAHLLTGSTASAQTLDEALAAAYENNPTLNAQRARLRATNEQVPQALSGYRPTLRAFSEVGRTYLELQQ